MSIAEYTDSENEEYENSEESIQYESVYFKYWFDGCQTIDDILDGIEALKLHFQELKNDGYKLTQPVDTGYCFTDKPEIN